MGYQTSWETGGIYNRFSGFLSGDELARSAEEIAVDPRFDDVRYIINDFAEVTGHSVDAISLERIALVRFGAMRTNPNIRVVVVASDPGLAALAELATKDPLAGSQTTLAFATLGEARSWLARQPISWQPRSPRF